MHHGDYDVGFTKVVVKAGAAANELVDLAGNLYAAEPGAYDDEVEVPTAAVRIVRGLGLFHLADYMLAKIDGVTHDLKRECVIGHSWNDSQVTFRATGDHYVVVVQACQRPVSVVKFNFRSSEVYPFHALGAAADSAEHLAQGRRGGVYIDGGSGDVRQEGMKDHMVLAVEEENLALGSAQFMAESFCELNGGKPSADDNDSSWLHLDAPVVLLLSEMRNVT
jgi:hypothetical protein